VVRLTLSPPAVRAEHRRWPVVVALLVLAAAVIALVGR